MPATLRTPDPLPDGHEAKWAAAAAAWTGGDYVLEDYATAEAALDGYAAFHASALQQPSQSLVFVPNQYGLGNRLRAMKAALLVAMLTGRVFHVRWDEPFPVDALLQPEKVDWRLPDPPLPTAGVAKPSRAARGEPRAVEILCLPFATAPGNGDCGEGLNLLQRGDLRKRYAETQVVEVHTFTDLNIYLVNNPHYSATLARLGGSCPKRMGCLYRFLFSPTLPVRQKLDALLAGGSDDAAWDGSYVGVQVRNRLWKLEGIKVGSSGGGASSTRIIECMDRCAPLIAQR